MTCLLIPNCFCLCVTRHVPQLFRGQWGAAEPLQAAASSGLRHGRSCVGHRQNWPHVPPTVHPPRPPAHAALSHPPRQVKGPHMKCWDAMSRISIIMLFYVINVSLKMTCHDDFSTLFYKCSVTKAWTTSTAWKWRTWCRCMTCCWRCWTPISCTAPVCLAGHPSRRPWNSVTLLLGHTAPVPPAPPTPGLPAAPEAEVNRSSRIRIQMQWLFTLYTRLVHCGALLSLNPYFDTLCTNSSEDFSSSNFTLQTDQTSSIYRLTTTY